MITEEAPTIEETLTDPNLGSSGDAPPIELSIHGGLDHTKFRLTASGIDIDQDITFEQWHEGLGLFKWMQSKMKIGFSDYVSFGRIKFGKERTEESLAQLEFDMPTVKAALEIGTVPLELRKPGLEAEHFVVLARSQLSAKQQVKWAETASLQKLSPNQLKHSIDAGEVVTTTVARSRQTGTISLKGIRQEFDIWLRRMDGIEGIRRASIEVQEDLLSDLQAFHELYMALVSPTKPARKPKKAAKKKAKK
jgi:hypothetical protein